MTNDSSLRGFTLIELMITLVIGMVVLAGVISVFISNTRLSTTLADRTERLGDLYTASHIMQTELRSAQKASLAIPTSSTISYIPLGSICPAGGFTYRTNPTDATIHEITWKRPEKTDGTCNTANPQQLIRDLDPLIGMNVVSLYTNADGYTELLGIDLYSVYTNPDQATKTIALSFKVWVRN